MGRVSRVVLAMALLLAAATASRRVAAAAGPVELRELPEAKLRAMAPLLRGGEIALIESREDGHQRQVTVMSLIAAPPSLVKELVTTPERYGELDRNITNVKVQRYPEPPGVVDYQLSVDLKLLSLYANHRLSPAPDGGVLVADRSPHEATNYRYQFLAVPGGTVLVMYGYTAMGGNGLVRSVVAAAPTMEHGLALSTQLLYVLAVKTRAQKLAKPGSFPPADRHARGPGFGFLLERGRVAVMRSTADGKLSDISVMDVIRAPRARVEAVILDVGDYRHFIDGVRRSFTIKKGADEVVYELEQDLSVFSFNTRFALRQQGAAIDVVGVSGDLASSHYRWDLTANGAERTLAVYRASQNLAAASPLILGNLIKVEPIFDHGLAVALGLVQMAGVRARAERPLAQR